MNLGVNGVSFKDLATLFRYADTVVINGEVSKNNFGGIQDLDEKGVAGRKEYLEEVVEVKEGKVRVYSEGILEKLVRENNGSIEDLEQERHFGSKLRAVIRHNFVGGIESIEKLIRVEAGDYIIVGEENSIKVMSETKFIDLYEKIG